MSHEPSVASLLLYAALLPACPMSADGVAEDADGDADRDPGIEAAPTDVEAGCDGLDEDGDGAVDEGCACAPGDTQPCYGGAWERAGVGACVLGSQTCLPGFELGAWSSCEGWARPTEEVCGDGIDADCSGDDEPCEVLVVTIDIEGDCVTTSCPASHPFPVGCDIAFVGGDRRGCVAAEPGASEVYFQEGDHCTSGHVSGTLSCATTEGRGLDAQSCPIDKEVARYVATPGECPGH